MFEQCSWLRASLGALALTLPMCTAGTETDNPLVEFDASACKSGAALTLPSTVMRSAPGLTLEPDRYDGLYCYAWELTDAGALEIDVLNYASGCHIEWAAGPVALEADQLTLTVRNAACAVARCGSCIYDFAFEVQGVDPSEPLELALEEDDCHGIERDAELTLPIDERSEGVICREKRFSRGLEPVCGTAHTPPCTGDHGPFTCERGECGDPALACVGDPSHEGEDICLEACASHEDCSLEIERCVDGLCVLRETF